MEQLADLLWVGGVIARQGSSTYQKAWGYLQPACVHYLFGLDATFSQMVMAAENLRKYANLVEELVAHGRVRSRSSDCLVPECGAVGMCWNDLCMHMHLVLLHTLCSTSRTF
jgi:hypothetical protein